MNIRCFLRPHFWWLKAMTPAEINACINAGATWPPLIEICLRCEKERSPIARGRPMMARSDNV